MNGIVIHDELSEVSTASCPTNRLAPGAHETCTAQYTVTAADVIAGQVRNVAYAAGVPPRGSPTVHSPTSAVTVPAKPAPATPTSPTSPSLPFTGNDTLSQLGLAGLLLIVGSGLVLITRRRRRNS